MSTTFAQLGVPSFICDALAQRDIHAPFEIQAATVADGLAGRDVLGRAPTGSGKTIAFGVPLVASTDRADAHRPRSLVLAPTRELAEQITTELRTFSGRLRVDAVYGGVGYGKQLTALRRGVDILVACPGRLEDLIERRDVDLRDVDLVVLDEADRMADMGFMPAVKRLLDQTSDDRQTLLFSATLDGEVAKLTERYQHEPVRHEVGDATPDVTSATHRFFLAERMDRNPVVAEVVNAAWPSIVFTRTRHGADRLARQLRKLGFEAAPIHGGLSQNARQRALDNFTKGRVHALIATDVAARGIHVDGVASVIHYDPPEDHKTYIHRSGRTARAGAGGLVVSLVQPEQRKAYRTIQRQVGIDESFIEPSAEEIPDLADGRELTPPDPRAERAETQPSPNRTKKKPNRASRPKRQGQGGSGRNRRPDRDRRDDGQPRGDRSDQRGSRDAETRDGASRGPKQNGRKRHAGAASGAKSNGAKRNRQGQGAAKRSDGSSSAPKRQNGSKGATPSNGSQGGRKQPNNRKARRAHLQPGNR